MNLDAFTARFDKPAKVYAPWTGAQLRPRPATDGDQIETLYFYNGEVTLEYNHTNHTYTLIEGDKRTVQDGVTTVLKIIDRSELLVPWASKMCAEKILRTVPVQTGGMGDRFVHLPYPEFEQLVLSAKSAHRDKLESAGHIGHLAHDWIERYIKSQIKGKTFYDPMPEDAQARNGCVAALDWAAQHGVRFIHTERKIYSRQYGYAGTLDGLALINSCAKPSCCPEPFTDRLSILDWKTSNYLSDSYVLQTASYLYAYVEETGQNVSDRWIVRLGKDDGEFEAQHHTYDKMGVDLDGFLEALQLTRTMRNLKARIRTQRDLLTAERKATKQADRREQMAQACSYYSKYKGTRKPGCETNAGGPCVSCTNKYEQVQLDKAIKAGVVKVPNLGTAQEIKQ